MSTQHRLIAVHNMTRAVILFVFAIFIAYLVKEGFLQLYIAPRLVLLVKLTAITLYVMGMFQLSNVLSHCFGKQHHCHCGHTPTGPAWKQITIYGLFILPILLGVLLPNTTMGTAVAMKKGMNLSASSSGRTLTPLIEQAVPTGEFSEMFSSDITNGSITKLAKSLYEQDVMILQEELFMESITAIDLYKDEFQGKTIELVGFVYRDPEMNNEQFVIGRFTMDCCSADALPYGILVESNKAARYQNDEWLKVRGTIGKTMYQGRSVIVIAPTTIERMEEPDSPYVYPNYNY